MKRRPTSLHDLISTVACVSHPDLDVEGRHFLMLLASRASFSTGRNSHPGFEFLRTALGGMSTDTVARRARKLERLGLIEVTRKPDGKGVATEWRICIENDAYPDLYPTYKPEADSLAPQHDADQESALAPQKSAIGPQNDGFSSAPSGPLVRKTMALAPRLLADPSFTSTPSSSSSSSSSTSATIAENRSAKQFKELKRRMMRMYAEKNQEGLKTTPPQWEEVKANFVDYGSALASLAWEAFVKADECSMKFPLVEFNAGFASYLVRAENGNLGDALEKKMHDYRWHLVCLLLGENFLYGFRNAMTPDQQAIYDRHRAFIKRTSGDPEKQMRGIDLACAGDLERLQAASADWMVANAELVARMRKEEEDYLKSPQAIIDSDAAVAEDRKDEEPL